MEKRRRTGRVISSFLWETAKKLCTGERNKREAEKMCGADGAGGKGKESFGERRGCYDYFSVVIPSQTNPFVMGEWN